MIAILGLYFMPVLAASAYGVFADLALVGGLGAFINVALDLILFHDVPINLNNSFNFLGLMSSMLTLAEAITVGSLAGSILPVIGIIGFTYWIFA